MNKSLVIGLLALMTFVAGCQKKVNEVPLKRPSAESNASITASLSVSTLRSDGTMLVNGQPFFPVGYYAEGYNTLTQNNYAANTISAAGFNTIFTEHDAMSNSNFSAFLNNCAAKGIYNILSFWDPSTAIDAKMNSFIPMFKNKPSVLVWCIGDDASTLGSESDILRKHNLARSLDASHLTYESFNDQVRTRVIRTVSQSAGQSYVKFLPGDLMDGYGAWPAFVDIVTRCKAAGKTPYANLQTFKWDSGSNFLYPSAAECDVQSYMSIVAGMKGILYYTFKDYTISSTINISQPALWDASVKVASEINSTLKDVLLNGVRTTTANTTDHVYYGKWVYNNATYIIAVNVDQTPHAVSIPVTGSTRTNLFAGRPATLTLNSNTLSGTLGALQTQIYKIN